jgi:low temperature requirement protein LtrA
MNWLAPVLGIAVLLALGAGLFLSPSFRAMLVSEAFKAADALVPVILKRKTLDEEKKDHEKLDRGQQVGNDKKWGHQKGVDS